MGVSTSNRSGKKRAPIQATIKQNGTWVPHRLAHKPATVEWVAIGTSNAGAAALTYDYANSTATNMKLFSNVNNIPYIITPVEGPAPVAVTVVDV